MLIITVKVNNVEFQSQTKKQIDDAQKECTSHFMMMKITFIGQHAKSEWTSGESKQDSIIIESNDAKVKMNQRLFWNERQYQILKFQVMWSKDEGFYVKNKEYSIEVGCCVIFLWALL